MKATLQKLIGSAVLGLVLCAHNFPTWAGQVTLSQVEITGAGGSNGRAKGSMAGVRYSGDSQQYIGCTYTNSPSFMCLAKDKTGKALTCTGYDPGYDFAPALQAINDSSYIDFIVAALTDGSNASCSYVIVSNYSNYLR